MGETNMHSRTTDIARFGVCDDTDAPPSDLDAAHGLWLAFITCTVVNALVGMLIALAVRWA
jgi:hypothetical protein